MIASAECGAGPALVWAHGLGVSRHMWDGQVARLRDRCRCVTFDARAHGDSPVGERLISVAGASEDLLSVAADHHLEQFTLIGASMGARTVLEVALAHPERVTALVISDVTEQATPEAQARLAHAAQLMAGPAPEAREALAAGPGAPAYIAHERAAGRTPFAGHDLAGLAATLRHLSAGRPPLASLDGELARLRCPVLVICGAQDAASRGPSRRLAAAIPGARHVEVPGAGHLAALDAPDAYGRHLAEFLDEVHLAAPRSQPPRSAR